MMYMVLVGLIAFYQRAQFSKWILVVFCLSHWTAMANAQDLAKAHRGSLKYNYYKLSNQQAEILYRQTDNDSLLSYMSQLVLEVPNDSFHHRKPQEPGHYLCTYVKNNTLHYSSYSKPFLRVNIDGVIGEGQVRLYDFDGKVIRTAKVQYTTRRGRWQDVPFDEGCGCFSLTHDFTNRIMRIEHNGQVDFYTITNEGLQTPSISRKNIYRGSTELPGYFICNKPKYRHFDTLRMKAFLVNASGFRLRRKLALYMSYNNRSTKLADLEPTTPGAYVYDFVIGDSLQLNKDITLKLFHKGVMVKSNTVFIEDYELQKATYTSTMPKRHIKSGEEILVVAEAFDVNGLPMLDTRVKVNVRWSNAETLIPKQFRTKDTFLQNCFSYNELIDETGTSVIAIPKKLMLPMLAGYEVEVQLLNVEGEYKSFKHYFTYDAKASYHKIEQKGNLLVGHKFVNGGEQKGEPVTIWQQGENGHNIETLETNFPFSVILNPSATQVKMREGDSIIYDQPIEDLSGQAVAVSGVRRNDSVVVTLRNDWDLDVYYRIYRNKKVVAKGFDKSLNFKERERLDLPYYVVWGYQWAGKAHLYETPFVLKEKSLNVTIHQPEVVFPGEKVDVRISVKDYKNRPRKKVNLTAYAVNMAFPQIPIPDMPYFGKRYPKLSQKSSFKAVQMSFSGAVSLTNTLFKQIQALDTNYYLHYLFPLQQLVQYQASTPFDEAELVPMVFHNGEAVKIEAIWLDQHLVMTSVNDEREDLIIRYPAGTYNLTLRLPNKTVIIKELQLEPQKRTYLSLDSQLCNQPNVQITNSTNRYFTETEMQKVNAQTLFVDQSLLTDDTIWIENAGRRWLIKTGHQHTYGRVYFSSLRKYLVAISGVNEGPVGIRVGNDTSHFRFTQGHYYVKEQNLFKGYRIPEYPLNRHVTIGSPVTLHSNLDGSPLYFSREKRMFRSKPSVSDQNHNTSSNWHKALYHYHHIPRNDSSKCKITLFNSDQEPLQHCWLVHQKFPDLSVAAYGSFNQELHVVNNGTYDLVVISTKGKVFIKKDIHLKNGDHLFVNVYRAQFAEVNVAMVEPYRSVIHDVARPLILPAPLYPHKINGKRSFTESSSVQLGNIRGTINDKITQEDLTYMQIILERDGYLQNAVLTNAWGEFIFKNLDAGEYMLKVLDKDYRYTLLYNVQVIEGKSTVVDISLDKVEDYRRHVEDELDSVKHYLVSADAFEGAESVKVPMDESPPKSLSCHQHVNN